MKRVFLIVFILTFVFNIASAGWWGDNLPVPVNTHEIKQEKRAIGGAEFDFIYYECNQDPSLVKDFYRKSLRNLGWQEKQLVGEINTGKQGVQLDSYSSDALKQNLIFEKKDEKVVVTVMPATFSQDGVTRFSVARGKLQLTAQPEESTDSYTGLLTQPKKDVAPVYPGANLFALTESKTAQKATYIAEDDIERVIWFYKSKMSEYGWSLTGENPLEKVVDEKVTPEEMLKACPNCSKEIFKGNQSIETWAAQLFFSNQEGDGCNLDLSGILMPGKTQGTLENMTTIIVNYEEKK